MLKSTPIGGLRLQKALTRYFCDAKVSIKVPTAAVDDCNEPVNSFGYLEDHIALPAVVAPGDVYAKMKRQESLSERGTTEMEYRRVMLAGAYPLIQLTYRLLIDDESEEWEIVAINIDQTETFTQMLIQRLDPRVA